MKSSKLFKWKNFRNHISETCKINYAWDRFTDMTFIVQKRRVTAHKIILSANSEFFKMILNETPSCVHPTISLPDVNYEDLDAILQFIYTGELLVHHDRLESVLSLASCFQVKSLMKVQAALIKQNRKNKAVPEKVGHDQDTSASSSQSQLKLEVSDILASSSSQNEPKLETLDILASISQCQPKLEISDVLPSSSKSQSRLEISDVLPSSSKSQSRLEISDVSPSSSSQPRVKISDILAASSKSQQRVEISDILASSSLSHPKSSVEQAEQVASYKKAQRNKKSKEHFKNLFGNEKVGQTSSTPAPGELRKKKGRKPSVPRSEILMVGGKSNGRALTPKTGVAPRSSHKCIKEKLLREFEKGGTIKEVSKLFNISPSCAFYYKKCFVKAGKLSPSMINYQKKSLYKSTRNKKVAEKARVIDCRPSQPVFTAT